jgi:soluble lytic murein transglycosylase
MAPSSGPPAIETEPKNPSLSARRRQAYQRAVSFIMEERFDEALAFIRKQSASIRDFRGLKVLEAGLLSASDVRQSLELYYQVINSKGRDRHWSRAMVGYRYTLERLSEKGDFGSRAKLIRTLGLEWRNREAIRLIERSLAQDDLPSPLREELNSYLAVLALRLGDFAAAGAAWEGKKDTSSLKWLSTLRLRQGRFEEAAAAREELAKRLKGASRSRERERLFDILTKAGFTQRAEETLSLSPELKKMSPDYNFRLGLSALAANRPDQAAAYFELERNRPKGRWVESDYFKARALEVQGDLEGAKDFYRRAAVGPLGYYRLLAEGRLATLTGTMVRLPLGSLIVRLLAGPGGDSDKLGFYLWLSERLNPPFSLAYLLKTDFKGSSDRDLTLRDVSWYLNSGQYHLALEHLKSANDNYLKPKTAPDDPLAGSLIYLSAKLGYYRLTVGLLNRLKVEPDFQGRRWNHPLVYSEPVLFAWKRLGLAPQLTLSVIRTESAFEPEAVSLSNARGLMQLLPSTALSLAQIEGEILKEEELFEPNLNIRYGTNYLANLIRSFGSSALALAAYNGGPFNIKAYMTALADRPLDLFIETLPFAESSRYVKVVLESVAVYEASYLGLYNYLDFTSPVGPPPEKLLDF